MQLAPVIQRFMASECYKSGVPESEIDGAEAPLKLDTERTLVAPIPLRPWIAQHAAPTGYAVLYGAGAVDPALCEQEYLVEVFTRNVAGNPWCAAPGVLQPNGEVFVYNLEGSATLHVADAAAPADAKQYALSAGDVALVPGGGRYRVHLTLPAEGITLIVTNSVA